jgi:ABC-type antimicrobial peptide transport system permease subunit
MLAVVGLYGYSASELQQRAEEFGVRMAVGASRRDVRRLVLGRALQLAAPGVLIGLLAAGPVSRLAGYAVYCSAGPDVETCALAVVLLLVVAMAACGLPARRFVRRGPVQALKGAGGERVLT